MRQVGYLPRIMVKRLIRLESSAIQLKEENILLCMQSVMYFICVELAPILAISLLITNAGMCNYFQSGAVIRPGDKTRKFGSTDQMGGQHTR